MALQKFTTGLSETTYAQIELNNVAWRRDGRIEAQCKLDPASFTGARKAENGMILAVDKVNGLIKLPVEDEVLPLAVHYSTEHLYDERTPGLENFALRGDVKTFLPRMGYPSVGDLWTTNCIGYDTEEFTNDDALIEALNGCKTTPVYGTYCTEGFIKLTATKPANGFVLKVVKYYTMPNGAPGVKVQALGI